MTTATAGPEVLDRAEVEGWDGRWLAAWNKLDLDAIVSMCAPDVVYDEPALPEPARGRAEVRSFLEAVVAAYPDLQIEALSPPLIIPGSNVVLARYRLTATMTGHYALANFAPTGARMCFEGVDQWTLQDGVLSHYYSYYDSLDVARQLGILPATGSRAEKLMARVQHVQARGQRRRNRS